MDVGQRAARVHLALHEIQMFSQTFLFRHTLQACMRGQLVVAQSPHSHCHRCPCLYSHFEVRVGVTGARQLEADRYQVEKKRAVHPRGGDIAYAVCTWCAYSCIFRKEFHRLQALHGTCLSFILCIGSMGCTGHRGPLSARAFAVVTANSPISCKVMQRRCTELQ